MDKHFEVPQKDEISSQFRTDLRPPKAEWGRCAITGDWGPVIALDLGDISIEAPVIDRGVVVDPETNAVSFTQWRPAIFQTHLTISQRGLELIARYLADQTVPPPMIKPDLVYAWTVMYTDGSVDSQFKYDPATFEEAEQHAGVIDWSRVHEIRLVPHHTSENNLPSYTFVPATHKFFRAGVELSLADLDYTGPDPEGLETTPYYMRKVHATFGSTLMDNGLSREVHNVHSHVLQLLGWAVDENTRCVIGIDERGNFRPYDYGDRG